MGQLKPTTLQAGFGNLDMMDTPFNGTQPVHEDPAPAAAAAADSDVDAATAAIAGGAAFALGAALSSLIVIRRQGPRPAA